MVNSNCRTKIEIFLSKLKDLNICHMILSEFDILIFSTEYLCNHIPLPVDLHRLSSKEPE